MTADHIWVTWMECTSPPEAKSILQQGLLLKEMRLKPETYLELYRNIGGPVNWDSRLKMDPQELAEVLSSTSNHCFVLQNGNESIGLCEFQMSGASDAELQHFGLLPREQGKGLAVPFLQAALQVEFAKGAQRVWLHTDEWDSAAAIRTYEKAGFRVYDRKFMDPTPL